MGLKDRVRGYLERRDQRIQAEHQQTYQTEQIYKGLVMQWSQHEITEEEFRQLSGELDLGIDLVKAANAAAPDVFTRMEHAVINFLTDWADS